MHLVNEIAVIEVAQRRLAAVEAAFDPTAEEEMRGGGAVIGPVAAVLRRSATKLGIGHDENILPTALSFHRPGKRRYGFRPLTDQPGMGPLLISVSIESAEAHFNHG